jgi:hypothetical protein
MSFKSDAAKATVNMNWFLSQQKLKGNNFTYLEATDEHSPYDGVLLKGNFTGVVEVKVRPTYTFQQICSFGGQMLEMKKLKGIEDSVAGTIFEGKPVMYFIFYKDCLAVWKLKSMDEYKWFEALYPQDHQGGYDTIKQTVNLPQADGVYYYENKVE